MLECYGLPRQDIIHQQWRIPIRSITSLVSRVGVCVFVSCVPVSVCLGVCVFVCLCVCVSGRRHWCTHVHSTTSLSGENCLWRRTLTHPWESWRVDWMTHDLQLQALSTSTAFISFDNQYWDIFIRTSVVFCHHLQDRLPLPCNRQSSAIPPGLVGFCNVVGCLIRIFSHLLDHSSLNWGVGKCNYSNLERDQLVVTITISSIPPVSHIEVEVDVHDAVALPITALVVQLGYVSVALLPKDHEAWGVGYASSILALQVTLCWEMMCQFKERNGFVKRLMMLVKSQ